MVRRLPNPLVSVLLPVRNDATVLPDCLASLSRQTLTDIEVVAVDDGSVDASGAIIDAQAARDARVRVLHRPGEGLVAALNAGLSACRGELIARIDADDVAHPRRLELQVALLGERRDVGVASCLVRHFPWARVAEGFRVYEAWLNSLVEPEEIARERFVESPVAHPSVMVRRELLERVGGYRDTGGPEDYDLWLRLLATGAGFAKVRRYLHFWRDRMDRLTRTDPRYAVERFLECKAEHLVSGPLARAQRVVVWGAGQTGRRLSKHLLRLGAALAAFVDIDPAKIGRTVRGVPVVGTADLPAYLGTSTVILAAVASRGARTLIRQELTSLDLVEGREFWCVA